MTLKAVFLDAGNTLFAPHPSVGHVYAERAARHGFRVEPAWVEDRFRDAWVRRNGLSNLKKATAAGEKLWWAELVQDVFDGVIPPEKFQLYFDELYDFFAEPACWRLFPETLGVLDSLRARGLALGIVSNWDSRLHALCDGLGVTSRVDFILASAVLGSAKPEPGIFNEALRRAGVRPDEAVHVGDSPREDYVGATEAGLRALLLCRRGKRPEGFEAIGSLDELEGRLEKI